MNINKYELILDRENYTLVVYLDSQLAEFANELGRSAKNKTNLQVQIRDLINEKFPNVPITAAKVMVGSLLVTTIYLSAAVTSAGAQTTTTQVQQTSQFDVYRVQSGDSLYSIAKRFNVSVTSIKTLNGLTSDAIYVGQVLNLPFFTYTVVSGDSLSLIAKRFNTTMESIKLYNQLSSDSIFVGQKIKIPKSSVPNVTVPPPTTVDNKESISTYTVMAGDSLSLIAKKLGTTVDTIRSLNNLTTDMIFIGQVLKVPKNQTTSPTIPAPSVTEPAPLPEDTTVTNPTPTPDTNTATTTYKVVSGDSLSLIAKKFATTVEVIKLRNNLTSDVIFVGQTLTIPQNQVAPVQPTEPPKEITTSYIVVAGDSLSLIAKRFNTTVDAIKSANQLSSDIIYIGQKLTIPTKEPVTVDTVAPTVPVLNPTGTITTKNQSNISVSGSTEAHAAVSINLTDGISSPLSIQIKADANGRFETKVDVSMLKDGNITIISTATDAAGNRSAESRLIVKKDTVTLAPTLSYLKGINQKTALAYPLSGTAEPGSAIQIVFSDGVHPTVTKQIITNERGEFSTIADVSRLTDGNISISAKSVDTSGNESTITKQTITKDTIATEPVIDITNPITIENVKNYTIFGVTEPGAKVEITISDGVTPKVTTEATANETGEFRTTVDLRSLTDGQITITARAIDLSGNNSLVHQTTIVKDTIAEYQ